VGDTQPRWTWKADLERLELALCGVRAALKKIAEGRKSISCGRSPGRWRITDGQPPGGMT
jgi:hypothetical protein